MYLPEYTRTHGVNSKASTKDALLLSMLPYGLLLKTDAVSWYSGSNGSHKVSLLVEDGYIKEYHIRLKSKRYIYSVKFLGLTGDGIRYLAATYSEDYPWLRTAVDRMDETGDEISFRDVGANATVKMLLRIQSANVFYNRAGARTIFDRLRDNPYQALCAMRVLTGNTTMRGSAIHLLADALESWLRRNRPDCRIDNDNLGEYFDAIELRAPKNNPYTIDNYLCNREDFEFDDARGRYRVSYIGALRIGKQVYLTYRSTRDGAKWNGNMVLCNRDIVSLQLERVGIFIMVPGIRTTTFKNIVNVV